MKKLSVLMMFLGTAILSAARGDNLNITSFGGNGQLVFNEMSNAVNYCVECAPTPAGPWTTFDDALTNIVASCSGVVTCSVTRSSSSMFYRIVAECDFSPSGMVRIPGGTNSGTDPDYGAYSLTVSTFYMDKYEVTKAQWDVVYNWAVANGYQFDHAGRGKASDHPVQTVNWYDCVKWCNARSQKEGRTPCYNLSTWACNFSSNGYRMPTSDEWEYAARGGLSGKRFPWGDRIDHSRANYRSYWSGGTPYYPYDDGYEGNDTRYSTGGTPYTSPAGAFAANGYGLYDMAGNVWEWCNDSSGLNRCIRGGSWYYNANHPRCGYEPWSDPGNAGHNIGFRAACR